MNTKNIFKVLALAMLMPAMLLTTACSKDDDAIVNPENTQTENTVKEGYPLQVTVNVTREGDDAANSRSTRATYNESTKKLEFSEGDKLFVKGKDTSSGGAGRFAGTLDYVPATGKFSGTITTRSPYTGTVDNLLSYSDLAILLPAGYGTYGYLTIYSEGYSAEVGDDKSKAFALSKAAAIEQFSYERVKTYSGGFSLSPENAILNFTITGLVANKNVTASLVDDWADEITGEVTTDANGTATFAIGLCLGTNLKKCTLTVDGKPITLVSSDKNTEAGHIYNITREAPAYPVALGDVTRANVGNVVTTDGYVYATASDASAASKTAVAMIAYISSTGHGLALALSDEGWMNWWAAKYACENNPPLVTGGTWKLATMDEWKNMISGAGGYAVLRDRFSDIGGDNLQRGYLINPYWSSSELSDYAWTIYFDEGYWGTDPMSSGAHVYARACLAF